MNIIKSDGELNRWVLYDEDKTIAYEGFTGDIGWQTIASIRLHEVLDKSWDVYFDKEHKY